MSAISNGTRPKGNLRSIFSERNNFSNEENIFCTHNNLEQSLNILNEEFESFGISPITVRGDLDASESLKELPVKVINATWNLIHKHRSLMRLHDELTDLNHKTVNDNINLKNHVKRLKQDMQKKEHVLCEAQEKERRLKVQCDNASRDLKHEKEEIRKLKKQAQSKDIQHEHEVRRIMQNGQKLQEQLQKSIGTFVSRDKALQKKQSVNHEKELASYNQTIYHLEEDNKQMAQEIKKLKETLELHKIGFDLHIEASGVWTNVDT
ncbi:afadin- and alpha-actinin-binding protein [Ooceraea biroi]|nr:afadin- and alpha-actinin-binding protein [Ooceraea biroi]EZA57007.1 Afadin- and alpha-actinin-binding protein [Ooceraea biroi]